MSPVHLRFMLPEPRVPQDEGIRRQFHNQEPPSLPVPVQKSDLHRLGLVGHLPEMLPVEGCGLEGLAKGLMGELKSGGEGLVQQVSASAPESMSATWRREMEADDKVTESSGRAARAWKYCGRGGIDPAGGSGPTDDLRYRSTGRDAP